MNNLFVFIRSSGTAATAATAAYLQHVYTHCILKKRIVLKPVGLLRYNAQLRAGV